MGDGVAGSTNAPANQPTNAGRSGTMSAEDAATKAKFSEALNQELCPPGLSRRPREGCNYLRPPADPFQPSKPIDINIQRDPGSPMSPRSDGPDLTKPIPKKPDSSLKLPDTVPFHDTTPSGTHVFGVKVKI